MTAVSCEDTPARNTDPGKPPSPVSDDDRELLARAIASYSTYLMFVAGRLKGQHLQTEEGASDLVQKTLVAALTKIRKGTGQLPGRTDPDVKAWLRKVLVNTYHDMQRYHRARKRTPGAISRPREAPSPSCEAMLNEEAGRLAEARKKLDTDDRQLLEWRDDQGVTFEEIGRRRGFSASYASRAYRRARARFDQDQDPAGRTEDAWATRGSPFP
jgi:RNA polymerase sigma factor (sigma-70 family)